MDPSDHNRAFLEEAIAKHRRNLRILELQAIDHGSLGVPLTLTNAIHAERESIERYESELRTLPLNTTFSTVPHTGTLTIAHQSDLIHLSQANIDRINHIDSAIMPSPLRPGSAPPLPKLLFGREDTLRDLKIRLGIRASRSTSTLQVLTAIRGWPGIGKTSIAAALAHDSDIRTAFPDGVLWMSLGGQPNLLAALAEWGRALGIDDLFYCPSPVEASARLRARLRDKAFLLIIDDVWEIAHAEALMVGGVHCATLITTREQKIAQALSPTPNDIYVIGVLDNESAFDLLRTLAPTVIQTYPNETVQLVRALEGLPLALQVAGHLLQVEASYGFGVTELLAELQQGAALLNAPAPADRIDLVTQTTPTVAALLHHSTDRLDRLTHESFALLGAFAPEPATFDLESMCTVWDVKDARPIVRELLSRGLLEYIPEINRYQMHALLVTHAISLLND
jgi:hypothetical protein